LIYRTIIPRKLSRKGRADCWVVRVPIDLQMPHSPRTHFFPTEDDAHKYAADLTATRNSPCLAWFMAQPVAHQSALRCHVEEMGFGGVLAACRAHRSVSEQSKVGFTQLAADCIRAKEAAGRLRENTTRKMWVSINSFSTACTKPIHAITTDDVVKWLDGKGGSLDSRLSRLGIVSEIFSYAVKNQTLPHNPCASIERPKIQPKQAVILTVKQIEKIVRTALKHDKPLLGYLAPVIWGGLRHTESLRMTPANIGAEVINLHGEQTKTGKRSFEITPTLKAWLAVKGVKAGSGTVNNKKRMAKIEQLAGVTIPRNALRKTCASMWFKLKGSREAARICGHSEAMLERNYKNADIPKADAERFASLRPAA